MTERSAQSRDPQRALPMRGEAHRRSALATARCAYIKGSLGHTADNLLPVQHRRQVERFFLRCSRLRPRASVELVPSVSAIMKVLPPCVLAASSTRQRYSRALLAWLAQGARMRSRGVHRSAVSCPPHPVCGPIPRAVARSDCQQVRRR